MGKTGFLDDLFENGDPDFDAPSQPIVAGKMPSADELVASEPVFIEKCPSCKGSGNFYGSGGKLIGKCFKCKGRGSKNFKTSPESRAKKSEQRYRRKILDVREAWKLDAMAEQLSEEQADAAIQALDIVADRHQKTRTPSVVNGFTEADEWTALQLYKRRADLSMLEIAFAMKLLRKYKRQFGPELTLQIYGEQ